MRIWGGRAAERVAKTYVRPVWQAYRHRNELHPVANRMSGIPEDAIIVFVVARNEAAIMPSFLKHYRGLGAGHFVIVDNDSTDGMDDIVQDQPDCSLWRAHGSYRDSRHGVAWLNHLLRRYGNGHWCLTVDADEFLDFPHSDTRSLPELTAYLDAEGRRSFFTILLDMYPEGPLEQAHLEPGQNPLDISPWFDAFGYQQKFDPGSLHVFVQGGVRRRVYFSDTPDLAPALNKVPLVKWQPHDAYAASTHVMRPAECNRPHFEDRLAPTGVLLHFKMLASLADKAREEMVRRQHWEDGREYEAYLSGFAGKTIVWNKASAEYRGWNQLVDLGLMNVGAWV